MERNSFVEGLVIVVVFLLIIFLINRNRKDRKKFEQEMNQSEIKPEKHEDDRV